MTDNNKKDDWKKRIETWWRKNRVIVVGLISVALGLFLIIEHAPFLAQPRSIRFFAVGWLCFLPGFAILLLAGHTFWPELILAVVIVLVVVGLPVLPIADEADKRAKVPIPSSKFAGGIDFLWPGQVVGLVAYVPNATGTPEAQVETYGKVMEARGKENPVVLIAVPPESADDLQKALLAENAKLTYHLLTVTPTATPTPAATETLVKPSETPKPTGAAMTYVEIAADKIEPRASTLGIGEKARLVIVEKYVSPTGTPEAVSTTYRNEEFCVTGVQFLDEDGVWQDDYDKDETKQVLVEMKVDEVARFARSMAAAEHIWMVNDTTCEP